MRLSPPVREPESGRGGIEAREEQERERGNESESERDQDTSRDREEEKEQEIANKGRLEDVR